MQVSRRQAALALDVVRRRHRRAIGRHQHQARGPKARPSPVAMDLVFREIDGLGPVRIELVQAASARRAADVWPTADEVADMALRRAICDRLR
jgi:hypothetical protein